MACDDSHSYRYAPAGLAKEDTRNEGNKRHKREKKEYDLLIRRNWLPLWGLSCLLDQSLLNLLTDFAQGITPTEAQLSADPTGGGNGVRGRKRAETVSGGNGVRYHFPPFPGHRLAVCPQKKQENGTRTRKRYLTPFPTVPLTPFPTVPPLTPFPVPTDTVPTVPMDTFPYGNPRSYTAPNMG